MSKPDVARPLPVVAIPTMTTKKKPKATSPAPAVDCYDLAKRIPFRMLMHMSGEKAHSGRYTNAKLGIGHEYHHPAKKGYIVNGGKVKRWFYREEPIDAPCYPTLRDLLANDDELRTRAEAEYPKPPCACGGTGSVWINHHDHAVRANCPECKPVSKSKPNDRTLATQPAKKDSDSK